MNKNNNLKTSLKDILEKKDRILSFLDNKKLDAAVIGKPDNFAWFTCGGNNQVVKAWDTGFSYLIISREKNILVSQIMDGPRVIDEELKGLEIEYMPLKWTGITREEQVAKLIRGRKVISDTPVDGAIYSTRELYSLHYPFTELETRRVRWLAEKTEEILRATADAIIPGITEIETAGMLLGEFGKLGIECEVLLIGSDERIGKYRHPVPADKKIKNFVLLHPATKKWGLHVPMTRMLSFGIQPAETVKKYEAACKIASAAISMCKEGEKITNILDEQMKLYKELGYEEEWGNHFHGGITGYQLVELVTYSNKDAMVILNQPHDWFITLTGVKVEEICLTTEKGIEVITVRGNWPVREHEYRGFVCKMPEILYR